MSYYVSKVPLGGAVTRLEGATMDWVSVPDHMDTSLSLTTPYASPHPSVIWEQILVCGGADQNYHVNRQCYWWSLKDNLWYEGPIMLGKTSIILTTLYRYNEFSFSSFIYLKHFEVTS